MTGYLANLVEQTLVSDPAVKPRLRSRFESPAHPLITEAIADHVEQEAARPTVKPGPRSGVEPAADPVARESVEVQGRGNVTRGSFPELRETKETRLLAKRVDPGRPMTAESDNVLRPTPREDAALLPSQSPELDAQESGPGESESDSKLVPRTGLDRTRSVDHEAASSGDRHIRRFEAPRAPSPHTALPEQLALTATPEPPFRVTSSHTVGPGRAARPAESSLLKRATSARRDEEAQRSVRVRIGRVDVRAHFTPAPIPTPKRGAPKPRLSLKDYLTSRSGGSR